MNLTAIGVLIDAHAVETKLMRDLLDGVASWAKMFRVQFVVVNLPIPEEASNFVTENSLGGTIQTMAVYCNDPKLSTCESNFPTTIIG